MMTNDQSQSPATENPHRRKPQRSPNYPYIDLPTAIQRMETIYRNERRAPAPWDVVAGHWNYSAKSSSMDKVVGALNAYGLVNVQGSGDRRQIELTSRALDIVEDERDVSPERDQAIRAAALSPAIHRSIRDKYGKDLPSDANIRTWLVREEDFNPKAVDSVIANYRSSIEYAGLDKAAGAGENSELDSGLVRVGDLVQWVSQGQLQWPESRKVVRIDEYEGERFVFVLGDDGQEGGVPMSQVTAVDEASKTTSEIRTPPKPPVFTLPPSTPNRPKPHGAMRDVYCLAEGDLVLEWPERLSQASYDDAVDWLDLLKRKLGRAVKADEPDIN